MLCTSPVIVIIIPFSWRTWDLASVDILLISSPLVHDDNETKRARAVMIVFS